MNIDILVQNASSVVSDNISNITGLHGSNASTTSHDCRGDCRHDSTTTTVHATTADYNDTVATTTNSTSAVDVGGLSPMAVHFLAVGALFAAVLILAVVNAYLHFRSVSRRHHTRFPDHFCCSGGVMVGALDSGVQFPDVLLPCNNLGQAVSK